MLYDPAIKNYILPTFVCYVRRRKQNSIHQVLPIV